MPTNETKQNGRPIREYGMLKWHNLKQGEEREKQKDSGTIVKSDFKTFEILYLENSAVSALDNLMIPKYKREDNKNNEEPHGIKYTTKYLHILFRTIENHFLIVLAQTFLFFSVSQNPDIHTHNSEMWK